MLEIFTSLHEKIYNSLTHLGMLRNWVFKHHRVDSLAFIYFFLVQKKLEEKMVSQDYPDRIARDLIAATFGGRPTSWHHLGCCTLSSAEIAAHLNNRI